MQPGPDVEVDSRITHHGSLLATPFLEYTHVCRRSRSALPDGRGRVEQVLLDVFRELPCSIAIVAPTGQVLLANEAMVRLSGRPRRTESTEPLELTDLLPQEILDASRLFERVRMSAATRQRYGPSNIRFRAPGVHRVYRYEVRPLARAHEPPLAMVVFEDITKDSVRVLSSMGGRALTAIDERLAHAERLTVVGRMMAGLAHEIKNPLSVVSGNAQFLSSTFGSLTLDRISAGDWKEVAAGLASIGQESGRCLTVISHILSLASRSGHDRDRRERVDLMRREKPARVGQTPGEDRSNDRHGR